MSYETYDEYCRHDFAGAGYVPIEPDDSPRCGCCRNRIRHESDELPLADGSIAHFDCAVDAAHEEDDRRSEFDCRMGDAA